MEPTDRASPGRRGKGMGVVIPTLAAIRDTINTLDVKGPPRQPAEKD